MRNFCVAKGMKSNVNLRRSGPIDGKILVRLRIKRTFTLIKKRPMNRLVKPAAVMLASIVLLFSACDKEYSTENGFLPGPGGGAANCKSCVYQPWCDGSTYTYIDTTFGGSATTVASTLDITGDTTINGTVFSKTTVEGETSYHNCTNGITTIAGFEAVAPGGPAQLIVNVFLKENSPVGTTWQDVISTGTGQNALYDYEIISKGGSRVVLGVTYNDVIHVHQTSSIDVPILGNIVTSETDYYYARNIGLIESEVIEALGGTLVLHRVLQSYNIP